MGSLSFNLCMSLILRVLLGSLPTAKPLGYRSCVKANAGDTPMQTSLPLTIYCVAQFMESKTVYDECNSALDILAQVGDSVRTLLQIVAGQTAKTLTAEPDLAALQKARKHHDQLLAKLQASAEKLAGYQSAVDSPDAAMTDSSEMESLAKEHEELRKESVSVSNELKEMLSQTYALQFQIDMLLASSRDQSLSTLK
ncbi:uncharacterized protein BYT42DRAFT_317042 [Radiomyces spectabilis]|uniref:uncharacterized protein n=1 Tax=Radiomyces spectabilis TaxID=64574 RepID=UPI0022204BE1|nr:uncharacterized protein BYT42DRAFT_317042 [Radiomyces spectabilis]KAI8379187.1 hypothetical protein BYT42DRAFT_317042 [Radiomyces spectabilis]